MKNRGLFKTILVVALVLWALYALWPTYKINRLSDSQRREMDIEGKLAPLHEKEIKLGLDLQGGMYLTYEVDMPELFKQLAGNTDQTFEEIMTASAEKMNVSSTEFLHILVAEFKIRDIPLHRYWGDRKDSDNKVQNYLSKQASDAMDRAMQKLRNRIDQFGVSEPNIQKIGTRRILIELPGITDQERAKALIGKTALLEFALAKDPEIFIETLQKMDRALARDKRGGADDGREEVATDTAKADIVRDESRDKIVTAEELFGETPVAESDSAESDSTALLVDENIFQENPLFALLRTEGGMVLVPLENEKAVKRIIARPDLRKYIPNDAVFRWKSENIKLADKTYRELFLLRSEASVVGKNIKDANVTIGNDVKNAGRPVVSFALDRNGARDFARVTAANLQKRLAIVLDSMVVSAPVIQSKIPDGRAIIEGIDNMDEAKMISIVLRVGALPAPLRIIEERTVGPSLGKDSIRAGQSAALIGFVLVVVFMFVYYRMAGLIANVALIMNLLLLMAVLAQFGFTLTLPGVAGIVLTIGMAVDANVLVFERIREELRTGKTVRAAIDAGYGRAFRTIMDANITTFFTALVLYYFGSGPVRGFAVTLSIGIVVSMFTALFVTRLIFESITSRKVMTRLSI